MKIGRRIFFDIVTGTLIQDTGESNGGVLPTTIEEDIIRFSKLNDRVRSTFDVIELEYGQFAQDFAICNSYRVNPETKELEFSYPDPNEPEEPQSFQAPLSEVVVGQTEYLVDVDFRLSMVELGLV